MINMAKVAEYYKTIKVHALPTDLSHFVDTVHPGQDTSTRTWLERRLKELLVHGWQFVSNHRIFDLDSALYDVCGHLTSATAAGPSCASSRGGNSCAAA